MVGLEDSSGVASPKWVQMEGLAPSQMTLAGSCQVYKNWRLESCAIHCEQEMSVSASTRSGCEPDIPSLTTELGRRTMTTLEIDQRLEEQLEVLKQDISKLQDRLPEEISTTIQPPTVTLTPATLCGEIQSSIKEVVVGVISEHIEPINRHLHTCVEVIGEARNELNEVKKELNSLKTRVYNLEEEIKREPRPAASGMESYLKTTSKRYPYRSDSDILPQMISVDVGESDLLTVVIDPNVERTMVPYKYTENIRDITPCTVEVPWRNTKDWIVRARGDFSFKVKGVDFTVKNVGVVYTQDDVKVLGKDFREYIVKHWWNREGLMIQLANDKGQKVNAQGHTHKAAAQIVDDRARQLLPKGN